MRNELDPVVGQWYQHRDKGELFEVLELAEGVVDIQDFDGNLSEIDMDTWREMDIELAAEPEDWTGPYDDIEIDDLGYEAADMSARDWREPLQELRVAKQPWEDTTHPDEREDEDEVRPLELYSEENPAAYNLIQQCRERIQTAVML